ncbi:hypothetical protein [Marinobacter sp. F4206]|uniref:hypothetical protein n=1 Tax=Marinobacter sp. F4206 TaxID=2861777 RepID=UPI001C5FE348|nr:hypothetical protein [Marinobacter sp. F4206]MBW4935777.1 hypothetical protein [Marinobacter sp. F4206]
MSNRIELTLHPSVATGLLATVPWLALLGFLVAAAHGGKPWLLAGIPVALAGAGLQYRRSGLLRGNSAINRLTVERGQLSARLGDGRQIAVKAAGTSRLGSRLALLKLRPIGTTVKAYSAILLANTAHLRGNVPEDEFRRLRVWLRLGKPQSPPKRRPDQE